MECPPEMAGYESAAASHRALHRIRQELERHPAARTAQGFPPETHTAVSAELEELHLDCSTGDATLTVRWFAGETVDARPEFSFHYSDDADGDFGWHHEPNPHVSGWGHFQERESVSSAYAYEPYQFGSLNPNRVVWEVMSNLSDRDA